MYEFLSLRLRKALGICRCGCFVDECLTSWPYNSNVTMCHWAAGFKAKPLLFGISRSSTPTNISLCLPFNSSIRVKVCSIINKTCWVFYQLLNDLIWSQYYFPFQFLLPHTLFLNFVSVVPKFRAFYLVALIVLIFSGA